jgi:CRP-like cAMP-binding protein
MPAWTPNRFLSVLSSATRDSLISHSVAVELPLHTVLYEVGCVPHYGYFLTSGLASVITPMSNGEVAEVGFIGQEGIVGSLQLLGPACLSTRCMMQLAGSGLKIPFVVLQRAFDDSEDIRRRILEFVQQQAAMVAQLAGCNRLHSAKQRLSRWLLMAQDRTDSDVLAFTHKSLSEMIGTQRTTVTFLARDLQERGLISCGRGAVGILDRDGLETVTCGCYAITKSLYVALYGGTLRPIRTNARNHESG